MRAKHNWIDIGINNMRCQRIFLDHDYLTYKDPNSKVLLLPFFAYSLTYSFTMSILMLSLSEIQSSNELRAAVNIIFRLCAASYTRFLQSVLSFFRCWGGKRSPCISGNYHLIFTAKRMVNPILSKTLRWPFKIRARDFWKQWIIQDRDFTIWKIWGKAETPRQRK